MGLRQKLNQSKAVDPLKFVVMLGTSCDEFVHGVTDAGLKHGLLQRCCTTTAWCGAFAGRLGFNAVTRTHPKEVTPPTEHPPTCSDSIFQSSNAKAQGWAAERRDAACVNKLTFNSWRDWWTSSSIIRRHKQRRQRHTKVLAGRRTRRLRFMISHLMGPGQGVRCWNSKQFARPRRGRATRLRSNRSYLLPGSCLCFQNERGHVPSAGQPCEQTLRCWCAAITTARGFSLVWLLNEHTETALSLLRTYYEYFRRATRTCVMWTKRFDIDFDQEETLSKVAAKAQTKMEQDMMEADQAMKVAAVAQRNVDEAGRLQPAG